MHRPRQLGVTSVNAFYEKVIKVKADVAAYLNLIVFHLHNPPAPSGPISESGYLGITWFTDSQYSSILSNCQPLTPEGEEPDGDTTTSYQTTCIDAALQLVFPTNPYTFTLLNGRAFTTYGVENSFIVPSLGNAELYSDCDEYDFCKGQTIPVYAHDVKR
jgi:hypothetical protein